MRHSRTASSPTSSTPWSGASAGDSAIEAAAPNHVAAVRRFFLDPLSADEVATLVTLLDRLLAGLAEIED